MLTTVFTKKEVAERLRVCERTIDNFVSSGKLRSTKMGRRRMFTENHLNELIKNGEL